MRRNWRESVAREYKSVSVIHMFYGNADLAIKSIKKNLKLREEIGNKLRTNESLENLILVSIEFGFIDHAIEKLKICSSFNSILYK